MFVAYGFPFRSRQGSGKGMKLAAVELANMTDTDSKEEQDTATAAGNSVPSKSCVTASTIIVIHCFGSGARL